MPLKANSMHPKISEYKVIPQGKFEIVLSVFFFAGYLGM
jgi:hypothetical protein